MALEEMAMAHPPSAVERATKVQEVIVRASLGNLTWGEAGDLSAAVLAASGGCGGDSNTTATMGCWTAAGRHRLNAPPWPRSCASWPCAGTAARGSTSAIFNSSPGAS